MARICGIFIFISIALFFCNSGFAQEQPAEMVEKALFCFDNKLLYNGCDEEYRLNQNGNINVPQAATEHFCNGPCLAETQLVLKCVNNMVSNFLFNNKASISEVQNILQLGCSYSSRRGNFNYGEYFQGEMSNAYSRFLNLKSFLAIVLIPWCWFYVFYML